MAIVVLAYVLSLEGGFKQKSGVKRYRNGKQGPAFSAFRPGLQHVNAIAFAFQQFLTWLLAYFIPLKKPNWHFVQ